MVSAVFGTARQDGCRSVATGVLGDEVVEISPGLAMRTFVADRRPVKLAQLATSHGNLATWAGGFGLARSASSVVVTRNDRVELLLSGRRARQREERLRLSLGDGILRATADESARLIALLDAGAAMYAPGDTPWSTRHRMFDWGYSAAALERYDRTAAAALAGEPQPVHGPSASSSSSSALPADQLVAGGWSKSILRRSMADQLPSGVVWNRDKPHLGWRFTEEWLDQNPTEFLRDLPSDTRSSSSSTVSNSCSEGRE